MVDIPTPYNEAAVMFVAGKEGNYNTKRQGFATLGNVDASTDGFPTLGGNQSQRLPTGYAISTADSSKPPVAAGGVFRRHSRGRRRRDHADSPGRRAGNEDKIADTGAGAPPRNPREGSAAAAPDDGRWDPVKKILYVDRTHPLTPGVQKTVIYLGAGNIHLTSGDEPEVSLTTHLAVPAATEDEARQYVSNKNGGFAVSSQQDRVTVTEREGLIINGATVVREGDEIVFKAREDKFRSTIRMGTASETIIVEGETIDVNNPELVRRPGLESSVVITVPHGQELYHIVETDGGTVTVDNIGGTSELESTSGRIKLSFYTGKTEINNHRGPIEVDIFQGNLTIHSEEGEVTTKFVEGEANVTTTSGNITMQNTTFRQSSWLQTNSGTIDVTVDNISLEIQVATNGIIRIPASLTEYDAEDGYSDNAANRPDRRMVEGFIGFDPFPDDSVILSSETGEISLTTVIK